MPEVIVIGAGTGVPSLRRASPAIVVKTANSCILLDSGPGTLRQLLKADIHFSQLDLILYTHFHPDHVADLIHFLFVSKNSLERTTPVFIGGPPGFLNFYENLKQVFGHWVEPPKEKVELLEIAPNTSWAHEDIEIIAFKTPHTEHSQGYCLWHEGKKIVYTGDTDYDTNLIEAIKGADLLICEASFPYKVEGHLTPALAGKLAKEAEAKTLLLVHLYPACERVDILAECRQSYFGPVFIGQDLLHLRV